MDTPPPPSFYCHQSASAEMLHPTRKKANAVSSAVEMKAKLAVATMPFLSTPSVTLLPLPQR